MDDIRVPLARGRQFARAWGSEYVMLGSRGHIGSDARLGMWPEGQALPQRLLETGA
ncbi:MAG: alpha/beta hydrolase [Lautropia sp.]|nr:alpha/beta hydrolase [Lautropia sp.]